MMGAGRGGSDYLLEVNAGGICLDRCYTLDWTKLAEMLCQALHGAFVLAEAGSQPIDEDGSVSDAAFGAGASIEFGEYVGESLGVDTPKLSQYNPHNTG